MILLSTHVQQIPIMKDGRFTISTFVPSNINIFSHSIFWASYSWHDKPYTNYVISDDDYCEFDSEYDLRLDYTDFKISL